MIIVLGCIACLAICLVCSVAYMRCRKTVKVLTAQVSKFKQQEQEFEQHKKKINTPYDSDQQAISIVAHDLKGPFNHIFALVQLMQFSSENLTVEQHEYLNKICLITSDGISMIRNLLSNRRVEEKGFELAFDKIDLESVLSSIINTYQVLGKTKNIELVYQLPKGSFIWGDKLYLFSVLDNLLSNALKFSPNGKKIYLNVFERDIYNMISIRDEGPGISEQDQKLMYRKMQRLSARPTGGESSAGLGLWIIKQIVEKMQGEIVCKSSLNEGTTFEVMLRKAV